MTTKPLGNIYFSTEAVRQSEFDTLSSPSRVIYACGNTDIILLSS